MRFTSIPVALLIVFLLITVPVGGAPALEKGSSATYNLSLSISLPPPLCETTSSSSMTLSCPMIVAVPLDFDVNGTLSWIATSVNSSTAVLNVTRVVTTSSWSNLSTANFKITHSFNESIDLATRVASIMPFLVPEIDQALQTAQTNSSTNPSANLDWTSPMNMVDSTIKDRHPIYTMWWVNGPLELNQTVPVLVFPTNVTGSTSINLGNIGTRDAWTLSYNLTLPGPAASQTTSGPYSIPVGDNMFANFTFNYDQKSDVLLSANADIHLGLFEELNYQTGQCQTTSRTYCPYSNVVTPIEYGLNLQASLTLTSTNLNLEQRLGSTTSSNVDAGSNQGSNSGTSTGSGGTTPGGNPGSSDNGQSSGSNTGSNSGNTPQTISTQPPATMIPWIYWVIGIPAIVIVAAGLWLARRRRDRSNTP